MKFGNDQIFDMTNFDETSRWMGWSKNEFSHSLALEQTCFSYSTGRKKHHWGAFVKIFFILKSSLAKGLSDGEVVLNWFRHERTITDGHLRVV